MNWPLSVMLRTTDKGIEPNRAARRWYRSYGECIGSAGVDQAREAQPTGPDRGEVTAKLGTAVMLVPEPLPERMVRRCTAGWETGSGASATIDNSAAAAGRYATPSGESRARGSAG